jgi:hypothetical protein
VAQHDDLQCCELVGTKAQEDKLQDALKRDVTNREEHDASRNTLRKRRPFYANRIKAPYSLDRAGLVESYYFHGTFPEEGYDHRA